MSRSIRHEVDLSHLPPLSSAQKSELEALSASPENAIDYSDIPPLDEGFWENAVPNPFCCSKPPEPQSRDADLNFRDPATVDLDSADRSSDRTRFAIEELEAGRGKTFADVDDLMRELTADD